MEKRKEEKTSRRDVEAQSRKEEKGRSKDLGEMALEEKLSLLSETDKAYICGYIDRALKN
jgi:hypothetical protein